MIYETKGDILDFINNFRNKNPYKTLIVIHQANCFNTLGKARGIAGVLDKAYPQIAVADQATVKGDKSKLGQYSFAKINNNLWIYNAYGQYNYGMSKDIVYTDYDALQNSLGVITTVCNLYVNSPVYLLPQHIGSGLANGDYEHIRNEIINPLFQNYETYLIYN